MKMSLTWGALYCGIFVAKKHRKPKFSMLFGAGGVTRTPDLLITNQLLYQLSYTSLLTFCGTPLSLSLATISDLLITKCIGVLHLTVFRDLGAFPLGILWEVHPILSTVSIHSFRCVGHGVGQQMLLEKTSLNKFAGLPPEELYEKRLEQEKPVLGALLSWANEMKGKTAPKSMLGKAIHYLLEQ